MNKFELKIDAKTTRTRSIEWEEQKKKSLRKTSFGSVIYKYINCLSIAERRANPRIGQKTRKPTRLTCNKHTMDWRCTPKRYTACHLCNGNNFFACFFFLSILLRLIFSAMRCFYPHILCCVHLNNWKTNRICMHERLHLFLSSTSSSAPQSSPTSCGNGTVRTHSPI